MSHITKTVNFSLHRHANFIGGAIATGWKVKADAWQQLADACSKTAWSPIIWKDGHRRKDNFLYSDLCVFDFDSGDPTLESAIHNRFADMKHIIGTTRNHQKDKDGLVCDRFRVITQWDRRICCPREYVHNMQRFKNRYDLDTSCLGVDRGFFRCIEIVSVQEDGELQDVLFAPEEDLRQKGHNARIIRCRANKVLPADIASLLTFGTSNGKRHKMAYYTARVLAQLDYDCEDAVEMIAESPLISAGEEDVRRTARDGWERGLKDKRDSGWNGDGSGQSEERLGSV